MTVELLELVGALAGLLAIFMGGNIGYTHWRVGRLEKCIERAQDRMDAHLEGRKD